MYRALIIILFISLNLTSCSIDRGRRPSSNDNLISSLSSQAWQNLSAARKAEVEVVKLNTLKFLLYASFKTDDEKVEIFSHAREYFRVQLSKISHNIKVESLNRAPEEFYKFSHPPVWNLHEEVQYMISEVPKEESYFTEANMNRALRLFSSVDLEQIEFEERLGVPVNEEAVEFVKTLQQAQSDRESSLLLIKKFEEKAEGHFSRIQNVGTELSRSGQLSLHDPDAKKFVVSFLDYYYSNVGMDTVKNILNDTMMLGHEPNRLEMMEIMFKNSGPGMGKTLQQLGKEPSVGGALSEVLEVLEDSGKEVPLYLIERIVKKDKGGFTLKEISKHALGTGTMAQVNSAIMVNPRSEKKVALRFLKPGIEKDAANDIRVLRDFIEHMGVSGEIDASFLPTARKLVGSIGSFLNSELDIGEAIQKQQTAKKVYTRKSKIIVDGVTYDFSLKVPKVYAPKRGKKTSLHIQEFVKFGKKFSDIEDESKKMVVSKGIMSAWFEEALLDSGYIHSDLHQGNFTVHLKSPKRVEVVLFDFGMSETLSLQTRRAFIFIGAGTELSNAKLIAKGILVMDGKDTRANIKKLTRVIEANSEGFDSPEQWILWAIKEKHMESDELGTLARGGALVSQLGKITGEDELHKQVIEDLMVNKIKSEYFTRGFEFPLSRGEVLNIGRSYAGDSCSRAIRSLFN